MEISARRLGGFGWRVLVASAVLYVLGGVFAAATWRPGTQDEPPASAVCEDPPCFDPGGMPGVSDLPVVLPFAGFALAVLLGVPGLLKWLRSAVRRRLREGERGWLLFFGPLVVLAGTEVIPHLLSPCTVAHLAGTALPPMCERAPEGIDVKEQWHALAHSLTGGVLMTVLYGLILKKWKPDVLRRH